MLFGTEKNPKGPSLRNLIRHQKRLSGVQFSFSTPVPFGEANSRLRPTPDEIDFSTAEPYKTEKDGTRFFKIFRAAWEYKGTPILQPRLGEVRMIVNAIEIDLLPDGEDLFNPAVFAREVRRELERGALAETHDGHGEDSNDLTDYVWPSYLGPLNWQWLRLNDVVWLHYELQPLREANNMYYWLTPLSQTQYLSVYFDLNRSVGNAGNPYRIEQRVPLQPYADLMHSIMGTVNLSLPPDVTSQHNSFNALANAGTLPFMSPSDEQIKLAEHILYIWSARGYTNSNKDEGNRADKQAVAKFLQQRIQPHAYEGAITPIKKLAIG